jgi:hypothetical protein
LQEPLCSLYVYSLLDVLPFFLLTWFCSHSQSILFWILGSLAVVCWGRLLYCFLLLVRGFISLLFSQFHCLTLCMMYAFTTLFDVACYIDRLVVCVICLPNGHST